MACLVFFVLALLASSTSAKVFLSIDCGGNGTYTDENQISWVSDDAYVNSGELQTVQSYYSLSQVMDTLRVFTTGTKNCYSIKLDTTTGEKLFIRASFYYGNYDSLFSPPSFDLQLNGYFWATVTTDLTNGYYTYYEAIYNQGANSDIISVCLVQTTTGQYPFISALEVRSLDSTMYSHTQPNDVLVMAARIFGSTTKYIRYPADTYDRIWGPTGLSPTSNSLLTIKIKVEDSPPQVVLQNTITTLSAALPVEFTLDTMLTTEIVPVYMTMYFAELVAIGSSDKRAFHVFIDNYQLTSTPVIPNYGVATELIFTNISASSTSVFSLTATTDSTLPPIINAFEVFTYGGNYTNINTRNINNSPSNGGGGGGGNPSTGAGTGTSTDTGNVNYNYSKKGKNKKKNNLPAILGSTIPAFLILWAIVGGVLISHYKKKSAIAKALAEGTAMANNTPDSVHHMMDSMNNNSQA